MNVVHEAQISTARLRMIRRAGGFHLTVQDDRQPTLTGIAFLSFNEEQAIRKFGMVLDREHAKLASEKDTVA